MCTKQKSSRIMRQLCDMQGSNACKTVIAQRRHCQRMVLSEQPDQPDVPALHREKSLKLFIEVRAS